MTRARRRQRCRVGARPSSRLHQQWGPHPTMTEFWALSRAESARRFTQTPAIRSDYRRATSRNEGCSPKAKVGRSNRLGRASNIKYLIEGCSRPFRPLAKPLANNFARGCGRHPRSMSALGQKQTCAAQKAMSALPRERTCAVQLGMSTLCQKRTSLPRAILPQAAHSKGPHRHSR